MLLSPERGEGGEGGAVLQLENVDGRGEGGYRQQGGASTHVEEAEVAERPELRQRLELIMGRQQHLEGAQTADRLRQSAQ